MVFSPLFGPHGTAIDNVLQILRSTVAWPFLCRHLPTSLAFRITCGACLEHVPRSSTICACHVGRSTSGSFSPRCSPIGSLHVWPAISRRPQLKSSSGGERRGRDWCRLIARSIDRFRRTWRGGVFVPRVAGKTCPGQRTNPGVRRAKAGLRGDLTQPDGTRGRAARTTGLPREM